MVSPPLPPGPGRLDGPVHQRDPSAAADGAAVERRQGPENGHGGPGSATLRAWDRLFWGGAGHGGFHGHESTQIAKNGF